LGTAALGNVVERRTRQKAIKMSQNIPNINHSKKFLVSKKKHLDRLFILKVWEKALKSPTFL